MSSYSNLIEQIDAFIRKFYKNQILKGLLFFVGILLGTYLLIIGLEYFGRFNSWIRAVLLFSFIGVNIYILSKYLVIPFLRLKSFGKRINRYQAAGIIGQFFPDISDRLLNTLQLSDQLDENSADFELIQASVAQKSAKMSTIPFTDAIDLSENRKYAILVLPVIMLLFVLAIFTPALFKQGTERVVNFTKEFPIEIPFEFIYNNGNDLLEEGADAKITVRLTGDEIPNKVYLKSDQGTFLMKGKSKTEYEAVLSQLHRSTKFKFVAPYGDADAESNVYEVKVVGKSAIGKMSAALDYPEYIGKQDELIENANDLTVNEGTKIHWSVLTKNTAWSILQIDSLETRFEENGWERDWTALASSNARVILKNIESGKIDTTEFVINVIKDQYPAIEVQEMSDSLKSGIRYFSGHVSDDFGVSRIMFQYTITRKDGSKSSKDIQVVGKQGSDAAFNFAVDFRREEVQLDDEIEYYFTVFDNDGVNGSKSSRSRSFMYKLPSLEELNEQRSEDQENNKDALNQALKDAEEFKKNIELFRKESLNSKQSQWQKENQVNQLQEQHQSLIEDLQNLQDEMQNSVEEKNQLSEIDEEILKQQEAINDLLEELMDDELKDLLDQLQELIEKRNDDKMNENLEDLEMSAEDLKKQLDRSLESLKKLQVNEKIDDIESELEKLAKEQEDLQKDIEEKGKSDERDRDKQNEINEKFDDLQKNLEELDSLNNDLDRPMELGDPKSDANEISDELQEANDKLNKGKDSKAGESQKNAAQKMQEMAESLDMMQQQSNQQQQEEDIGMLRNILESLVSLSFDQESVMNKMGEISPTDPNFVKNGKVQRKIMSDTKIVSDSLYELAKRQPKIAKFIDKELNQIRKNQQLSLENIDEREVQDLVVHQQYAMTSYNNLALMLNESLQQMQQQMQSQQPGSGSCNKPGGTGMPKPGDGMQSKDMKQMLKDQLKQMQDGSNPGKGKKPGEQGEGSEGQGMGSKQIAKMAAQQAAIRKQLEQMRRELNKDGSGSGNALNPLIDKLEEQEKELVNKRINSDLIERQKEILTRLLESEKALMERGLDEKRESKEGKNDNSGNQIQFDEYNKEKLKQIELLRSVDPAYNKYYQNRAMEYFNQML